MFRTKLEILARESIEYLDSEGYLHEEYDFPVFQHRKIIMSQLATYDDFLDDPMFGDDSEQIKSLTKLVLIGIGNCGMLKVCAMFYAENLASKMGGDMIFYELHIKPYSNSNTNITFSEEDYRHNDHGLILVSHEDEHLIRETSLSDVLNKSLSYPLLVFDATDRQYEIINAGDSIRDYLENPDYLQVSKPRYVHQLIERIDQDNLYYRFGAPIRIDARSREENIRIITDTKTRIQKILDSARENRHGFRHFNFFCGSALLRKERNFNSNTAYELYCRLQLQNDEDILFDSLEPDAFARFSIMAMPPFSPDSSMTAGTIWQIAISDEDAKALIKPILYMARKERSSIVAVYYYQEALIKYRRAKRIMPGAEDQVTALLRHNVGVSIKNFINTLEKDSGDDIRKTERGKEAYELGVVMLENALKWRSENYGEANKFTQKTRELLDWFQSKCEETIVADDDAAITHTTGML